MGADTKANTDSGGGGALELLEHAVPLDTARDDDGGRDAEPLVGEVDLLGWLRAPEFVDLIRVTIDTGKGEVCGVSAGVDRKASMQGGGALERGHGAPLERLAQLGDAL